MSENDRAEIRNRRIGFVFQAFNLLPQATAEENVELPLLYGPWSQHRKRAMEALDRVGLADRARHRPRELSGGQQQRVAIARALVTEPDIVLADEPTGNLDSRTGQQILRIFQDLGEQGVTLLLVTHDPGVARCAQRILRLKDGQIVNDERQQPQRVEEMVNSMGPQNFAGNAYTTGDEGTSGDEDSVSATWEDTEP